MSQIILLAGLVYGLGAYHGIIAYCAIWFVFNVTN